MPDPIRPEAANDAPPVSPEFREKLPKGCPPGNASSKGFEEVYRLVDNNPPVQTDFDSHEALGLKRIHGACPCRWASCSLFIKKQAALSLKKLPKFKEKFVASMAIPDNVGVSRVRKGHVDFWMFKSFDPTAAVLDVEGN